MKCPKMRKLTRKVQIMGGCTPGTDTVEKGAPELVVEGRIRLVKRDFQFITSINNSRQEMTGGGAAESDVAKLEN
jgi:hypothetical protein